MITGSQGELKVCGLSHSLGMWARLIVAGAS